MTPSQVSSIHTFIVSLFVLEASSNSRNLLILMKFYVAHVCVQQIPNALGVIVCVIQLTVYMMYYKSNNVQPNSQDGVDLPAYRGLVKSDVASRF